MRVCIIGAGLIGSSIAYELSKDTDTDVTVVDAAYPGWGATAASFAWVNANAKEPTAYFELNAAGLPEYERLASELGEDRWLNRAGCLITTPSNAEAELRVARARQLGYEGEVVSSERVMEQLEPTLKLRPGRQVAFFPSEAWLDVADLISLLLRSASTRGALSHFGQATTSIERRGHEGFIVRLEDGTHVECDVVVNAAGDGASGVASLLGRSLTLTPTLGITMRVLAPSCQLTRIVRNLSVDARPDGPDMIRLHAHSIDNRIASGGQDRNNIAAEFMRRADLLFHGFEDAVVIDSRIAARPMPEDGLTWAGSVTDIPGYFECITHSGITLGALLGRLVADEVQSGHRDSILDAFRPDRLAA